MTRVHAAGRRSAGPGRHGSPRAALALAVLLSVAVPCWADDTASELGRYNADIKESSISGISAGGFAAVQFATAWSSTIKGVGIIAGGPYYCAQATAIDGLLINVPSTLRATGPCMKGPAPALAPIFAKTDAWVGSRDIDDTANLQKQKIYIFSGYNDAVVARAVADAAEQFYVHYATEQNAGNIFFQSGIGAGHSQVTVDYGLGCASNKDYYIDQCDYDQAGILLQHIYGRLNPKNGGPLTGHLQAFRQRDFTRPASPASYSMAETGYVYVPASCEKKEPCRVHIALHGCKQQAALIKDRYTLHGGYDEWADTNHIIVLYPQTAAGNPILDPFAPINPNGCWDWWGYTNFNYTVKAGRQIAAIKAMLDRLTQGAARVAAPQPTAATTPAGLVVNDASDNSIDLVWAPAAGASAYKIYRAAAPTLPFALIGTVAGPSFGDAGLTPVTSYIYKVAAVTGGVEGDASTPVSGATHVVPPRCDQPGRCPLPP
jgi:hypothetical protein